MGILRLVELRVVRECNLPDNYTNFLRKMRGKQMEQLSVNQASSFQPGYSEYRHHSERRSSSFSSGAGVTGIMPDVATTSAFSTLSTSGATAAGAVGGTCGTEESPDLVTIDSRG